MKKYIAIFSISKHGYSVPFSYLIIDAENKEDAKKQVKYKYSSIKNMVIRIKEYDGNTNLN